MEPCSETSATRKPRWMTVPSTLKASVCLIEVWYSFRTELTKTSTTTLDSFKAVIQQPLGRNVPLNAGAFPGFLLVLHRHRIASVRTYDPPLISVTNRTLYHLAFRVASSSLSSEVSRARSMTSTKGPVTSKNSRRRVVWPFWTPRIASRGVACRRLSHAADLA